MSAILGDNFIRNCNAPPEQQSSAEPKKTKLNNLILKLGERGIFASGKKYLRGMNGFAIPTFTNKVIDDFAMSTEKVINNVKIHSTQHSEIDRKKGISQTKNLIQKSLSTIF